MATQFMNLFQQVLIKLGALFSYCGGPLIVCEMLKPRLGMFLAFAVPFVPILLMIFGAESLFDPSPQRQGVAPGRLRYESDSDDWLRWEILSVRLGLIGALLTLMMHAYGAWSLATTPPRPDHGLYVFGIVVGIPLAGVYAHAARRWLNRAGSPQDSFSPVEPR
jgi:cell division protein FtsW (lipid II flippase)